MFFVDMPARTRRSASARPPAEGGGFSLRTLGAIDLADSEGPCRALLAQPKRLALLVYLATGDAQRFHRRDELVGLFWPEREVSQARTALRQALRFLRAELGADALETRGTDDVRLLPGLVRHDARDLTAAARRGDHDTVIDLHRGDFLAGFFVANADPELEQWISGTRASLRRVAIEAVIARAAAYEAADRLDDAVRVIRRGIAIDPLDEPLTRQLMILLDATGQRAGALEAYDLLARRMARELECEPSPDSRTLRDRIHRRGTRPVAPPAVPAPAPPLANDAPLVILPFDGSDPHEVALGAGLSEMLHAALRQAAAFPVAPVASEGMARAARDDAPRMQKIVGPGILLDGVVRRANGGIEVSVSLWKGGETSWQGQFAKPATEVFALQEAIARAVSQALGVAVPAGRDTVQGRPTHDLEAYTLYLRGRWHWGRRPRETHRALECLEHAVTRDPTFALAHAAIADVYNTLGSWEASELPAWEAFPRAHAAARKALDLDPSLAEGRAALGYAELHYTWRAGEADRHLREAVSRAPTYAHAHHWHSHALLARGRVAESLAASRAALTCDPIDPVLNVHLAWHHWLAREPEDGIAQARRTQELHPDDHWAPFFSGLCELDRGRTDAAVASLGSAVDRSGGSVVMAAALAHALAVRGEVGESRRMLGVLEDAAAERHLLAYEVALVHAALGATDAAFAWLDRAVEQRSAWLAYAGIEPRLQPLRADTRFRDLLRVLRLLPTHG